MNPYDDTLWAIERLRRCYELASRSPDRSNQNAAAIYSGRNYVAAGVNRFPCDLEVTDDMVTDREKKYFYIEHAERSTIYRAAKSGDPLDGTTMVCPWFACSDCARAIILSGIKRVIGHKERMDMTPPRWKKNVDDSLGMLRQCGVEIELLTVANMGATPIIVNGELWTP